MTNFRIHTKFMLLLIAVSALFLLSLWLTKISNERQMSLLSRELAEFGTQNFDQILALKGEAVETFSRDYTYWDEMVDFVGTADATWAGQNIDTGLETFHVDQVWVYGLSNALVYSVRQTAEADLVKGELLDAPEGGLAKFFPGENRFCHFFMRTAAGLMEIRGATIHPTADAERRTAPRGYFLVGRLWNEAYLAEISSYLRHGAIELSESGRVEGAREFSRFEDGAVHMIRLLPGWDGKPVARMDARFAVEFMKPLERIQAQYFYFHLVFSAALLLILFAAIFFWVTKPIGRLSDALVESSPAPLKPIEKERTELGQLARLIRQFFEQKEELVRQFEERKRMEQQLVQLQKMESIGRLAGGIAHDFNNILTIILGYTELRLEQLPPDDPVRRDLEEIHASARRAADLTQQLLAFSRRQLISMAPVDLAQLLRGTAAMLRRLIGEHIEIITELAPDAGLVNIDAVQFEHVIINITVNARDAMPAGGTFTIRASRATLGADFFRGEAEARPGEYALLSFTDTGVGMTDEVKAHLFEPFFTTKERGRGTGLGLATSYGIVKQMGGFIKAEGTPGKGSTFRIYLPLVSEAAAASARETKSAPVPAAKGTETVLLVEDELPVRQLASRILREKGYRVLEARDGEEGLAVAGENRGRRIDLLLTDVVMPRMSGKELARQIKASFPDIKVIFMSGYIGDAASQSGLLEEGTQFIPKPFPPQALQTKVREVLDQKA
jgi:signal transduction histidine kinase/CheY-like chemotaxis protein